MEKWGNHLIILLVFSYILGQLFAIPYLDKINTILTIIIIIYTITFSRKLPKIFSGIMVITGSIILFTQGPNIDLIVESVTKNLPLVCLIIVVPILSVPINLGKYNEKIADFFSRFHGKPQFLYMIIYSFFYLLGPITNLGAIHIVHSMVEKMKLPANFLGRVYARGFSSINTWAPYFASVFLVVYFLEIPMYVYLPYGLLLSFFQFFTASLLFATKEVHSVKIEPIEKIGDGNPKRLLELLLALLLLVGIVFVLEPFITFNVSVLIIIVAATFAFLWSYYLKEKKGFFREINGFRNGIMVKQANEVALFLSAGFFGVVLSKSPLSKYINLLWSKVADLSIILLIIFTIILVSTLSFIGIHQIVIISSILASISPELLGLHDITFAMMLLSAWAIASTVSPIAPMNVISSNLIQVNVFHVIFKWNSLYTVLITIVHTIVIYIVHLVLT